MGHLHDGGTRAVAVEGDEPTRSERLQHALKRDAVHPQIEQLPDEHRTRRAQGTALLHHSHHELLGKIPALRIELGEEVVGTPGQGAMEPFQLQVVLQSQAIAGLLEQLEERDLQQGQGSGLIAHVSDDLCQQCRLHGHSSRPGRLHDGPLDLTGRHRLH